MQSPGGPQFTLSGGISMFNTGTGTANQYNGWPPNGQHDGSSAASSQPSRKSDKAVDGMSDDRPRLSDSDRPSNSAPEERPTTKPPQPPKSEDVHMRRDTAPQALPQVQDTAPPAQVATPAPSAAGSAQTSAIASFPVRYKFGFILPLAAGNSLTEKVKATIGEKLAKECSRFKDGRWALQTGFMHGRDDFRDLMKGEQYGRHNQIILITMINPSALKEKALKKLLRDLGGEVEHYGLLRLAGRPVGVITPAIRLVYDGAEETFHKDCGEAMEEEAFEAKGRLGEEFQVRFNGVDRWPSGHRCTPTYYTVAMSVQEDNSQVVKWKALHLDGPEEYALDKVNVQVSTDAKPYWDITQPAGRSRIDASAPFTETNATTDKDSTTKTAALEVTGKGFKGSFAVATMDGRDISRSTTLPCNGLEIDHHIDGAGKVTITYTPQHPDRKLVVHVDDLPKISVYPENDGPQTGTVTIKTIASWRLKDARVKELGFWVRLREAKKLEYEQVEDVVFCTELTIPWSARGHCTVPPSKGTKV